MNRPNIFHLFTDQQRFDTIRALGAGWMKTPALDRLCREGAVFTRAFYYACVSFIDHQVGRLLAELETSGKLDRTLIVFTADHGEMLGNLGCFGKRSAHNASLRVPLIARLPGRFAPGER